LTQTFTLKKKKLSSSTSPTTYPQRILQVEVFFSIP
jgi:hypothetical protein